MITRKNVVIAVLAVAIFCLRYWSALPEFNEEYAGSYIGGELEITGYIRDLTGDEFGVTRASFETLNFEKFNVGWKLTGTILLNYLNAQLEMGDLVRISGKLEAPETSDPRISAAIYKPRILSVKNADGANFSGIFLSIKNVLTKRLEAVFPEPESGFAAGLLLGARNSLPRDIMTDFKRTGLTHILAVSGYNMVILAAFFTAIFAWLPRKSANTASILAVCIFVFIVGASASVVRAAVMGSLKLVARIFGRPYGGIRALLITGFAMALFDPFIIFYDVGFQLSFGATAGILLFNDFFEKRVQFLPNWLAVRDSLATTWSAQVLTTPIILLYFKGISMIATAANIVVLPAIPFLMLGSFLSLIFGKITAAPTWILFEIVLKAVHFFSGLPFAFMNIGIS
ncbi:ComEC/Rec2 family competence protein [Candidatus Peregrinibacteria bacterium]|nr:ComEC/Rec2 family competence protein [Candidatus Peregrinibacteria bacterium]